MPARRSRPLAVTAAAAALLFTGCARENPGMIPREDAETLIASVEEVGTAVSAGECAQAEVELGEARAQVEGLPPRVARRLTERLREGLTHLEAQIPVDCEPEPEPEATAAPTDTPEPVVTPEPTETAAPTETQAPTPEPEETPGPEDGKPENGKPERGDGVSGEEDDDE